MRAAPTEGNGILLAAYSLGVSLSFAALTLADQHLGDAAIILFVALLLVPHYLYGRPRE